MNGVKKKIIVEKGSMNACQEPPKVGKTGNTAAHEPIFAPNESKCCDFSHI
jgi:hypothetical protein